MFQNDPASSGDPVASTRPQDADAAGADNQVIRGVWDALAGVLDGDVTRADLIAIWDTAVWPILKAVVLIVAVLVVSGWARRIVTGATTRARLDVTLSKFFGNMTRWAIMLLGGIAVLGTFGVSTTSFAAVIAAMGFAVGMAFSGTLGNFASGIMLLVFRPFKVGDVVNAAGVLGTVDEIGLFSTTFDTFDKRRIIVPNGKIFGDTIENITFHPVRRMEVPVGVAYGADVDATRRVLEGVVAGVEGRSEEPAPQVFLDSLGGSSVDWKLRVWASGDVFWDVHQRLVRDTKNALEKAGMEIPFPKLDVHVDGRLAEG